jgi:hypothetical protein
MRGRKDVPKLIMTVSTGLKNWANLGKRYLTLIGSSGLPFGRPRSLTSGVFFMSVCLGGRCFAISCNTSFISTPLKMDEPMRT